MKRIIYSSVNPAKTDGTRFYHVTLKEILKHFSKKKENCWLWYVFNELGLEALNLDDNLFGSFVSGDDLYVCVTDNKPVRVKGRKISPEYIADTFEVEDLQDYISEATDYIIHRYITEHEVYEPDFEAGYDVLLEEGYKPDKIERDAEKFPETD